MSKPKIGFVTCCLILLFAFVAFAQGQKFMSVQVKEVQLRSTPSFLGKIVTTIAYTEKVEVLEEKGDWMKVVVKDSSTDGWIHSSALTKKEIILKPGKDDIKRAVSSDEVVLAGKGFNATVEEHFKEQNSEVDYQTVDTMEQEIISHDEMIAFLQEGGVSPEGGAQ
jgi:uncharacterized protein YgiM (DUF1202 family)